MDRYVFVRLKWNPVHIYKFLNAVIDLFFMFQDTCWASITSTMFVLIRTQQMKNDMLLQVHKCINCTSCFCAFLIVLSDTVYYLRYLILISSCRSWKHQEKISKRIDIVQNNERNITLHNYSERKKSLNCNTMKSK